MKKVALTYKKHNPKSGYQDYIYHQSEKRKLRKMDLPASKNNITRFCEMIKIRMCSDYFKTCFVMIIYNVQTNSNLQCDNL